jgi:protein-disulfide isomerase
MMAFLPPYWSSLSYKAPPPFATGVSDDGYYWIGAKDPDLVIHEYVNHRCPHCKSSSTMLLRKLGENKNWRIVRHELPLTSCTARREATCQISRMMYCAAQQDKFWQADRWLFAHAHPKKAHDRGAFISDLQLDLAPFEACYASEAAFDYGYKLYKDSRAKGIFNVPAYEFEGTVPQELEPLVRAKGKNAAEE